MNVSKNLVASFGVAVCAMMTGCGGVASSEDVSEIRSLLEDLEIIESAPEANSGNEEVVEVPQVGAEQEEVAQEEPIQEEVTQEETAATVAGQLTWEPAGFYEDGTVMSMNDISHYEIVFGTSAENLSDSVEVNIAGLLTYAFEATGEQAWFVGVKTVSIYGGVSDVSNVVEFSI